MYSTDDLKAAIAEHPQARTGPVLSDEDPDLDGARVPLEYWKLIVTMNAKGDALRATAYLLSQGQLIRKLLEDRNRSEATEGVELGGYQTLQISVADLATALKYDFSAYTGYDPLGRSEEVAGTPDAAIFFPVEHLDDLVF